MAETANLTVADQTTPGTLTYEPIRFNMSRGRYWDAVSGTVKINAAQSTVEIIFLGTGGLVKRVYREGAAIDALIVQLSKADLTPATGKSLPKRLIEWAASLGEFTLANVTGAPD